MSSVMMVCFLVYNSKSSYLFEYPLHIWVGGIEMCNKSFLVTGHPSHRS